MSRPTPSRGAPVGAVVGELLVVGGASRWVHSEFVHTWALGVGEPPPLTLMRVFSAWTPNPPVLVAVVVLAVVYGGGVRALHRRGRSWPRARSLCCLLGGVGSIAVVGFSFIGVYADTLFWVRALQNLLLIMLTPLFFALGAPLTLLRELLPAQGRVRAGALLHSLAARVLTIPLVVTAVLVVPPLMLYLSPLYELSLRNTVVGGWWAAVWWRRDSSTTGRGCGSIRCPRPVPTW